MLVKFHRIILSMFFMMSILFLNGCAIAVVCLNTCFKQDKKASFYPQAIPNTVINQPYAIKLYIGAGYINHSNIHWKILPNDKTFKITSTDGENYNNLFFSGTPEKIGQYQINISGTGFIHGYPRIPFNHTYMLNILNQSSICDKNNIIFISKKDKNNIEKAKNNLYLTELPNAMINHPYSHQLQLTALTERNVYLSKNDVEITTYPQDADLQIRPVHGASYNTVELYANPKTIGNIEIILKRYSVLYKRYILPVTPNQSYCQQMKLKE